MKAGKSEGHSDAGPELSPKHATLLRDSAIAPEVIAARGYRTITVRSKLRQLGFSDAQAQVPALLIPVHTVRGDIGLYQIRPDEPRIRDKGPLKYETAKGTHMVLDVPPLARAGLGDPAIPLFITEGARKADAAVSRDLCCVALLGVWSWRGTNDSGGKVALADFEAVALNDRTVYIVFDSDVMEKRNVYAALARLKPFLEGRGATVRVIYLQPGKGAGKVGLDDYFATGGTVEGLLELATDKLRSAPPGVDSDANGGGTNGVKYPFKLTERGVLADDGTHGGDYVPVCSRLEVLARTRNTVGEEWGRLLAVTDSEDTTHEWAMPMALLAGDGTAYRERLLSMGLHIEPGSKARNRLHSYITTTTPAELARCVERVGWHSTPTGTVYVLPDHTYGAVGDRVLLQTRTALEHALRGAGTLVDWQEQVAAPCGGNSRLVFALSCAFAAPLLDLVKGEGGGFHLRGASSIGKTTALRVAASAWGGGGVGGYLRTWRATANGLEGLAELHSDALLCLDEMGQVQGQEAGEVAYMLANGSGKHRASRDGSARRASQWRVLFLSTGELSLADKMSEAGRRARAGQETRLVDVPADAGAGHGLFEDLHGFTDAHAFAVHLCDASGRFYGVAVREYLARLTTNLTGLAETLTKAVEWWASAHCPRDVDGQVRRLAARFGLMAAAGELASAMGILPWRGGEAVDAAARCFRAWLDARGGTGAAEITAGLAQVRHFFALHGESRFSLFNRAGQPEPEDDNQMFAAIVNDLSDRPTINRAGFRRLTPAGVEYFVFPTVWREEVCRGFDARALAHELIARGILITDKQGKAQTVKRLSDKRVKRLYHLSARILEVGSDDARDSEAGATHQRATDASAASPIMRDLIVPWVTTVARVTEQESVGDSSGLPDEVAVTQPPEEEVTRATEDGPKNRVTPVTCGSSERATAKSGNKPKRIKGVSLRVTPDTAVTQESRPAERRVRS